MAEYKKEILRKTGINIVGDVSWGTHFCVFYQTKEDLIDILVPYFKAGLENNEFCMWVTSKPLNAEDAKKVLKQTITNLDDYINKGQLEILDYNQWYTKTGRFESDKVLQGWIEKEEQAIKRGFSGLRLTGNTFWLEEKDWKKFADYEAIVNNVIGGHKMLAICTYSLEKCGAVEIVDVVANHQFALIEREKKWEIIESTDRKKAEERIKESAGEWQRTFDSIADLIFIMNNDNTILRVNKAFSETLKMKPEEIVGKKCYKLLHKKDSPWVDCPFERTKKDKAVHIQEVHDVNIGIPILVTTSPIFNERGEVTGAVHTAKDITLIKDKEKELQKRMNDLERFHKVTVGRELEMVELKKEINSLLEKSGQPKKYEAPGKIRGET